MMFASTPLRPPGSLIENPVRIRILKNLTTTNKQIKEKKENKEIRGKKKISVKIKKYPKNPNKPYF